MKGKRMSYRVGILAFLGISAGLIQGPVLAQQAGEQPAPAQQPAQGQPPAQAQQPAATQTIYSPWTKLCAPESPGATPTCLTLMEARTSNGKFIAGAGLIEQEGVTKKTLRITLPLAMLVQKGVQLTFDQDKPFAGPYLTCLPAGCLADFDATPELVEKMRKGQGLTVKAINLDGTLLTVPLPFEGFAKTNAGPPVDPKVLAEQQKKAREAAAAKAQGGGQGSPPPSQDPQPPANQ
jgi:invasion protein IalB